MLKIRRDSTVSELDERLKEAKLVNKKFRKQLLQKDSELQVSSHVHQTFKQYYGKYYFAGVARYVAQSVQSCTDLTTNRRNERKEKEKTRLNGNA